MYTFEILTKDGWIVFENKNSLPTVGMIIESNLFRCTQEVTRVILDIDKDLYTIYTKDL